MGGPLFYNEIAAVIARWPELLKSIHVFIETGTNYGVTIRDASSHFRECYTIEIDEHLSQEAKRISESSKLDNIRHYTGDSVTLLPSIIQQNDLTNHPILFFLDAHDSGAGTGYNEDYPVPLIHELEIISKLCTNTVLLCIDDARLFGATSDPFWSYVSFENIHKALGLHRIKDTVLQNDRYWVLLIPSEES